MGRSFLPTTDSGLLTWSVAFSSQISATPVAFGLVAAQATAYAAVHSAYAAALATATNESTRTKGSIAAKNVARTNLKTMARNLAGIIEHTSTVTNQQKLDLGLTVRNPPSPVPAPSTSPTLEIVSVNGWTVKIKLHDSTPNSRKSKPAGVTGASVFSHVGAEAPTDIASWKFEGNTTRTAVTAVFPGTVAPGSKVWLTAFWFNGRAMSGPACAPVAAYIQYGAISQAA